MTDINLEYVRGYFFKRYASRFENRCYRTLVGCVCFGWFICPQWGAGSVSFRVRHGFTCQPHSEGAEGRKGERRPAWAQSSVAGPWGPGLWEPWWAAGDGWLRREPVSWVLGHPNAPQHPGPYLQE